MKDLVERNDPEKAMKSHNITADQFKLLQAFSHQGKTLYMKLDEHFHMSSNMNDHSTCFEGANGNEKGTLCSNHINSSLNRFIQFKGMSGSVQKQYFPHISVDNRKCQKKKRRLRSHNQTIDEWLSEEDGTDAYADLEDFIV
jgi:hypothetical protein